MIRPEELDERFLCLAQQLPELLLLCGCQSGYVCFMPPKDKHDFAEIILAIVDYNVPMSPCAHDVPAIHLVLADVA